MKVVINRDWGGFSLSEKAIRRLFELKGWNCVEKKSSSDLTLFYKDSISDDNFFDEQDLERNDPELVQVVKELGKEANGFCASLKIVNIPKDVQWHISGYDGLEHVAENHRTWY